MSRENVEAVRRTHAAFGRKDYEEMLATDGGGRGLDDSSLAGGGVRQGLVDVRERASSRDGGPLDGDQYLDLGGKVLVRVLVAQVWTFAGGKAVASRLYDDDRPTYLDVIQATVAAYNRGDLESVLQLVTEDIDLPFVARHSGVPSSNAPSRLHDARRRDRHVDPTLGTSVAMIERHYGTLIGARALTSPVGSAPLIRSRCRTSTETQTPWVR